MITDDPAKYPSKNLTAGGWAGGEVGLDKFKAALPPTTWPPLGGEKSAAGKAARNAKPLAPGLDINLKKDFGAAAGGFPGGEVGLASFLDTGRVPTRPSPPTLGPAAVLSLAAASAVAAAVYAAGSVAPAEVAAQLAAGAKAATAAAAAVAAVLPPPPDAAEAAALAPYALAAAGAAALVVAARRAAQAAAEAAAKAAGTAALGFVVLGAAAKILHVW